MQTEWLIDVSEEATQVLDLRIAHIDTIASKCTTNPFAAHMLCQTNKTQQDTTSGVRMRGQVG